MLIAMLLADVADEGLAGFSEGTGFSGGTGPRVSLAVSKK